MIVKKSKLGSSDANDSWSASCVGGKLPFVHRLGWVLNNLKRRVHLGGLGFFITRRKVS